MKDLKKGDVHPSNFYETGENPWSSLRTRELRETHALGSFKFRAAKNIADVFGFGGVNLQQLEKFQEGRINTRGGLVGLIPPRYLCYYDYVKSLYKKPTPKDRSKAYLVAILTAAINFVQASGRSGLFFYIIGHLMLASVMIGRGQKEKAYVPGMPKRDENGKWSTMSFRTSVALMGIFMAAGYSISVLTSLILPFRPLRTRRFYLGMSALLSGYWSTFFETFEPREQNGARWRKSLEDAYKKELSKFEYKPKNDGNITQVYEFEYDPIVEDFPPRPVYEHDLFFSNVTSERDDPDASLQKFVEEEDLKAAKFKVDSAHLRKKPMRIRDVKNSVDDFLGARKNVNKFKFREGLRDAYKLVWGVEKLFNKYSRKPEGNYLEEKDYSEFEPITGPFGFRDVPPEAVLRYITKPPYLTDDMEAIRSGKSFGVWRRAMRNIKPDIELKPGDI
jgi:hypothetical protein